jgi:hypothetical protein
MDEQGTTTVVHDVVDAPLETIAEATEDARATADVARDENLVIAQAISEHERYDQEHRANVLDRLERLEAWQTELSRVPEQMIEEVQQEPIEIVAETPAEITEAKKLKFFNSHPLRNRR